MLKGYDFFVTPVDSREKMRCNVCGTECTVRRGVTGPRNWLEAMGKIAEPHDEFVCPHSQEAWHQQALDLLQEMEETASRKIQTIIRKELADLLHLHNKQLPVNNK